MPLKIDTEKIKNLIETLKNINIKDLQSIDAGDIVNILRQRVDAVVNAVLVLITIVVMVNVAKSYGKKSQTLAWEIKQKEERLEVSRKAQHLATEYAVFLENFPAPILTDQLINKLSEFAAARQVRLRSFSPLKEKSDDYLKVAGVQLDVSSDSYKNVVLFMRDIEDSPYALVVGKWSAKMKEERIKEGTGEKETRKQTVEAEMAIHSVRLKDEDKK